MTMWCWITSSTFSSSAVRSRKRRCGRSAKRSKGRAASAAARAVAAACGSASPRRSAIALSGPVRRLELRHRQPVVELETAAQRPDGGAPAGRGRGPGPARRARRCSTIGHRGVVGWASFCRAARGRRARAGWPVTGSRTGALARGAGSPRAAAPRPSSSAAASVATVGASKIWRCGQADAELLLDPARRRGRRAANGRRARRTSRGCRAPGPPGARRRWPAAALRAACARWPPPARRRRRPPEARPGGGIAWRALRSILPFGGERHAGQGHEGGRHHEVGQEVRQVDCAGRPPTAPRHVP